MKIFERWPWLYSTRFLLGMYVLVMLLATLQKLVVPGGGTYNNFIIFKWSFQNLLTGTDLYALHPDQYYDLYKYSPTFAALMAPFWVLPSALGLLIWNLLNGLVPFWAVNKLKISQQHKAVILLFALIELLTSVQSSQSNGLMVGLMIGGLAMMDNDKPIFAALLICLGFYVKLFALGAAVIVLFYPRKMRFVVSMAGWGILLAALPLVFTSPDLLMTQYKSWLNLLAHDPAHELNFSTMTITQRVFGFAPSDVWYLIPGMLLLLLPLARRAQWESTAFRILWFASLLIWVVIFNHKAESPTFVVALFGVGLWAITEPASRIKTALLIFVFALTTLSHTDLIPPWVRLHLVKPYALKVLPCIVLWGYITWRLLRDKSFAFASKTTTD